jgi:hypothetical protein
MEINKPDTAVTNTNGNTVSVFINTTSAPETIAFATRVDFSTVPIVGLQAHWRDIPETIKSDLNSYCATSGTMSVFVINGNSRHLNLDDTDATKWHQSV